MLQLGGMLLMRNQMFDQSKHRSLRTIRECLSVLQVIPSTPVLVRSCLIRLWTANSWLFPSSCWCCQDFVITEVDVVHNGITVRLWLKVVMFVLSLVIVYWSCHSKMYIKRHEILLLAFLIDESISYDRSGRYDKCSYSSVITLYINMGNVLMFSGRDCRGHQMNMWRLNWCLCSTIHWRAKVLSGWRCLKLSTSLVRHLERLQ